MQIFSDKHSNTIAAKDAKDRLQNNTQDGGERTTHSTCRNNHPRQFRAPQKHSVRESSTASSGAPPA